MKKIDSDDKIGLGLALGVVFGLAISNLALGLGLGLVFGSLPNFKTKDRK